MEQIHEMNNPEAAGKAEERRHKIVKTSVLGIVANIVLVVFKLAVGVLSHSIAIVLDAVNNLTDAASSLITIVGTKLASRKPDRDHPFGHGRGEYLTAMIIGIIVLYAGITALVQAIKKIISPDVPSYTHVALVIIAVTVLAKIILGSYVKHAGERLNSDSLINSGKDALLDSVVSASTLLAAAIYIATGISTEAYLGAIISLLIIKAGIDMIKDTISRLLGQRADRAKAQEIKDTVCSFPIVKGAYDLVLNDYGPDAFSGSIHIEVPDTCSADELDELLRAITVKVYLDHNVMLTAIGVYSINTQNEEAAKIRDHIYDALKEMDYVAEIHGFYLNKLKKSIRFDVVVSFDARDRDSVYHKVCEKAKEMYPEYEFYVFMDTDFSVS